MGQKRGPGAHPRGGGRSLTAGMAAADHDDVEAKIHGQIPNSALLAQRQGRVKIRVSREIGAACFT
jgi:hypothetical protein